MARPRIVLSDSYDVDPATGCHVWSRSKNPLGYGRVGGRLAHRLTYEAAKGPIPRGLVLDHLCRNPSCCNPDHLEPVTQRENIMRGLGLAAVNASRVVCVHGHPFDGANTYRPPRGSRECKTCRREADRRRNPRRRAS